MAKQPLLNINTALAPDPDFIIIDGATIEMRPLRKMGIAEQVKFEHIARRSERITGGEEEPTEAEVKILEDMTDTMLSEILIDPPMDIISKLDYINKAAILQAFTLASETQRPALNLDESQPTSVKSSPPSKDSTEEAP